MGTECRCMLSPEYEAYVRGGASLPPLVCVITGESVVVGPSHRLWTDGGLGLQVKVHRRNATGS